MLCTETKRKLVFACFTQLDPQPPIFMICVAVKGKERGEKQEHREDKEKEASFFPSCPRTDRNSARADLWPSSKRTQKHQGKGTKGSPERLTAC